MTRSTIYRGKSRKRCWRSCSRICKSNALQHFPVESETSEFSRKRQSKHFHLQQSMPSSAPTATHLIKFLSPVSQLLYCSLPGSSRFRCFGIPGDKAATLLSSSPCCESILRTSSCCSQRHVAGVFTLFVLKNYLQHLINFVHVVRSSEHKFPYHESRPFKHSPLAPSRGFLPYRFLL